MALVKGVNSYATVAEADSYFADRLDVAAWSEASELQKGQSLVTATSILDGLNWIGFAVSDSQALAFPRVGSYFDPRLGMDVAMTSSVPTRVITATYELAYHLLNNDGILDDSGSVVDLQVGAISLKTISSPNKVPQNVNRFIKPLLVNSGTNIWWRAN